LPDADLGEARLEAVEGRLLGLGVDGAVVDQLDPRLEGGVQVVQGGDLRVVDLGEELGAGPKGCPAEKPLDLPLRVGGVGRRVDGADAEGGAGGGELGMSCVWAAIAVRWALISPRSR
jgi:hypothetical protein